MKDIKIKYIETQADLVVLERGDVIATDQGYRMCVETSRDISSVEPQIGLAFSRLGSRSPQDPIVPQITRYNINDINTCRGFAVLGGAINLPSEYNESLASCQLEHVGI